MFGRFVYKYIVPNLCVCHCLWKLVGTVSMVIEVYRMLQAFKVIDRFLAILYKMAWLQGAPQP